MAAKKERKQRAPKPKAPRVRKPKAPPPPPVKINPGNSIEGKTVCPASGTAPTTPMKIDSWNRDGKHYDTPVYDCTTCNKPHALTRAGVFLKHYLPR